MDRLDQLYRKKQADQAKRRSGNGPVARRVTWGRKNNAPPENPVHDYKLDADWFAAYQQKNLEDAEEVIIRTEYGLGSGLPQVTDSGSAAL